MGKLSNIFRIPELMQKLGITLLFLAIYRVGFSIPLPYIDQEKLNRSMGGSGGLNSVFNFVSMFSGGDLSGATVFGLGIMPYISAGIIMQLMAYVVPALHRLQKEEGQAGQKQINKYTRLLTVVICSVQAGFYLNYLLGDKGGSSAGSMGLPDTVLPAGYFVAMLMSMVVGTLFLMWVGEQIDEYGIGNGVSLIIMAGILARLPAAIITLLYEQTATGWRFKDSVLTLGGSGQDMSFERLATLVVLFVAVVVAVVIITRAQRRIPMQSARHVRGSRAFGAAGRQYLPIKINQAGVMPVIFASSLLTLPYFLFTAMASATQWEWARRVADAFQRQGWVYCVSEIVLIYLFSYVWTGVIFDPKEISENLKRGGNFIPGYRPGARTAEYIDRVLLRITYVGSAFLALIAISPTLVSSFLEVRPDVAQFFGGTSLLIVVSVALDVVQRINSHLVMRNYPGLTED